jgi:hypothetical protein
MLQATKYKQKISIEQQRVFGIHNAKSPRRIVGFSLFWLPDLDSNQGPAD